MYVSLNAMEFFDGRKNQNILKRVCTKLKEASFIKLKSKMIVTLIQLSSVQFSFISLSQMVNLFADRITYHTAIDTTRYSTDKYAENTLVVINRSALKDESVKPR